MNQKVEVFSDVDKQRDRDKMAMRITVDSGFHSDCALQFRDSCISDQNIHDACSPSGNPLNGSVIAFPYYNPLDFSDRKV